MGTDAWLGWNQWKPERRTQLVVGVAPEPILAEFTVGLLGSRPRRGGGIGRKEEVRRRTPTGVVPCKRSEKKRLTFSDKLKALGLMERRKKSEEKEGRQKEGAMVGDL